MLWLSEAIERLRRDEAVALVTVARTRGSVPRPAGAKMLVTADASLGSVGGGAMERRAVERARALLGAGPRRQAAIEDRDPGADRCAGAAVELVFERLETADLAALEACRALLAADGAVLLTPLDDLAGAKRALPPAEAAPELLRALGEGGEAALVGASEGGRTLVERLSDRRTRVWLFGAGHVGQALARALAPLPFHLTWVDDRAALLPGEASDSLRPLPASHPADEVAAIPPGAFVLAMSHSHALDFEIVEAALRRADLGFVGLIGNAAKLAQFRRRAEARGLDPAALARLVSPIGLPTIRGREPAVIAASVAAQLLERAEARA